MGRRRVVGTRKGCNQGESGRGKGESRSEGNCRRQGQYPRRTVDFKIPNDPESARWRKDKGLLMILSVVLLPCAVVGTDEGGWGNSR